MQSGDLIPNENADKYETRCLFLSCYVAISFTPCTSYIVGFSRKCQYGTDLNLCFISYLLPMAEHVSSKQDHWQKPTTGNQRDGSAGKCDCSSNTVTPILI